MRQRYKDHWQGRQRSSPTSGNLHVSEGATPKSLGSKRTSSTNFGFLGDEAHKPPCFRRINSRTFGPQEDISVIDGFREDTFNMEYSKLPHGSNGRNLDNSHIQSTLRVVHLWRPKSSRVIALIPRNLQEKSTGPTRSEHEALESLRFQRRIVRDYKFLHDVHRYLKVVRRRIGLHASTKVLVPREEGMRKITVFTRLLPSTELFHPKVRV
ncbi:hypothetical protein DY000_02016277 [Brassica cretica]|uniref:Uncharacterized protein n=1 Tax=Brassica cretica TaxID=69181 RepID=A0ABQ7CY98_BRACR|nr:hypothetical protein DY000_02016277 [Brassica cretica]